ncbi:MAG: hypothetical protein ACTSVO_06515 [Candidatus Heimdallarchaeaceae archaeon]
MKRKIVSVIFLVLLLGLGQQAQLNDFSDSGASSDLNVITAEDLVWTDTSILRGSDYTLLDTTLGDTFSSTITDSLITIQEGASDLCYAGIYATVPVTSDHLALSCEMRVTAGHVDARNGVINIYDPISLRRIDVIPIVTYRKDNTLDSGYNYFGIDYTITDYSEVIIFIHYDDAWGADWDQTIYVKDFQIHTDGVLPLTTELVVERDMENFTWTSISTENFNFASLPNPPLIDNGETDFNFVVNDTYLHFEEINSGTYDSYNGVYTTIPVVNDTATFSFEAKAKSNSVDITPNFKIAIYDPATSQRITRTPDIGCWNENLTETEFTYFEFSLSATSYTMVNLFIFYNDASVLNDQHEFWIRDFKISEESVPTPEIITINDLEWNTGKYVRDKNYPMQSKGTDGYISDISSDELHVLETGDTFDSYVAIYATVPVTNGRLAFSYEARAKAGHQYAVSLGARLIDPITLRVIENGIAGGYSKHGGYDTGWNYGGHNISAESYSELILFFYYSDAFSAVWDQEFWIRNLKIYTIGDTDVYSNRDKFEPSPVLDWTVGSFERALYEDMYFPLIPKIDSGDEFSYLIDGNDLHFLETGTGTYDSWVGAYTTVSVNDGYLALSYEVKAKSTDIAEVSAHCRFFDADTGQTIGTTIGYGISSPGALEVGYHHYEVNQTLEGYDEVIILFFYSDGNLANNDKEFWIRNLNIYGSVAGSQYDLDTEDPVILASEDLNYIEGATGNFIEWTISDESTGFYILYRNDDVIYADNWIKDAFVSVNVDYLVEGIYNYTLVATDSFGNRAFSTIIVTVIAFDTTEPVILTTGDVTYTDGTLENYINWTISDESSGTYELYRNGVLIQNDDWLNDELISVNVDYLVEGIYNYTLVATDSYGNQAISTVFVVVTSPNMIASPSLYILLIGFSLMLLINYRRKKRN